MAKQYSLIVVKTPEGDELVFWDFDVDSINAAMDNFPGSVKYLVEAEEILREPLH